MRSVLFNFSDCYHFVPQKAILVRSPDEQVLRAFPQLEAVWPLAAPPERVFRYEAALFPIGAGISPTQPHGIAFPSPQFPPFHLNFEHTR